MNIIIYNKQFKQSNLDIMLIIMLIFSTLITINLTSCISAWMGMEMIMMASIPMLMTKTNKSSNSMMSYFMIQAKSSSILLFMMMMNKLEINSYKINLLIFFIQISLLMKLGAAPFHWQLEIDIDNLINLTKISIIIFNLFN